MLFLILINYFFGVISSQLRIYADGASINFHLNSKSDRPENLTAAFENNLQSAEKKGQQISRKFQRFRNISYISILDLHHQG